MKQSTQMISRRCDGKTVRTTPTCFARLVIFTPHFTHSRSAPSIQRLEICSEPAATGGAAVDGIRLCAVT